MTSKRDRWKRLTDLETDAREKICDFGAGSVPIRLLRALSTKPIAMYSFRPHSESHSLRVSLVLAFLVGFPDGIAIMMMMTTTTEKKVNPIWKREVQVSPVWGQQNGACGTLKFFIFYFCQKQEIGNCKAGVWNYATKHVTGHDTTSQPPLFHLTHASLCNSAYKWEP